MPRTVSHAFALIVCLYTKSESPGSFGWCSRAQSIIDGQERAVRVEQRVHVGDVPHPEMRFTDLGRAQVAVAAEQARVVRDVASRLLEVGHEPAPLEHLREEVRRLLAREVHTAELGDGVVAVFEEHALVELFGALQPDRCVDGEVAGEIEVVDELVEEQAAQTLVGARVARRTARPSRPPGRFVSANTGPSRFVKYGRRVAASVSLNDSGAYSMGIAMVATRPRVFAEG